MSPWIMAGVIIVFEVKMFESALSYLYQGFLGLTWLKWWNDMNEEKLSLLCRSLLTEEIKYGEK